MLKQIDRIGTFSGSWKLASATPTVELERPSAERSTAPNSPMTLFVRIKTASGPRTIVASDIPLAAASQLTEALISSGHHAEFVDQCCSTRRVADWVEQRKVAERLSDGPFSSPIPNPFLQIVRLRHDIPRRGQK